MSNAIAGNIYTHIIDRVISESKDAFAEEGVALDTLEEMKEIWKSKLTELHIAHLPWDPQPAPPSIANPPTVPSNASKLEDQSPAAPNAPSSHPQNQGAPLNGQQSGGDVKYTPQPQQPNIKPDPDAAGSPFPHFPQQANGQSGQQQGNFNPQVAQQRAAGILHREFGPGAQASIQAGMHQPSGGLALPAQGQSQRQAAPTGLQLPGQYRPPTQHNQQGQQRGGGNPGNSQMDGPGDEDDEDAINSDLDDSEDELQNDESDDQNVSEVMVCVYDKVARVKNKWKCTLKDGVLTTNGKDYIFHKATGEFEW